MACNTTHVSARHSARQVALVNKPAGEAQAMDPKGKKRMIADSKNNGPNHLLSVPMGKD